MSNPELDHYQKAVIENAKWIDGVLLSGITLAGIIVAAKLIGTPEFEFQTLKFSINYAWAVFSILTVIHFYTAWLLNREIFRVWTIHPAEKCLVTFQEITATGGVFVRGLIPRTKRVKTIFGIQIYEMRLDDPSTWATHLLAVILLTAIVPFDVSNPSFFGTMLLVALFITILNWFIGSMWLVPLSELAIPKKDSIILARQKAKLEASPKLSFEFPAIFSVSAKGVLPIFSAVLTIAVSLFALAGISAIGFLYSFLNSIGWGAFFLKTLVAISIVLLTPKLIKRSLQIKRYGKIVFVSLFLVVISVVVALYLVWI